MEKNKGLDTIKWKGKAGKEARRTFYGSLTLGTLTNKKKVSATEFIKDIYKRNEAAIKKAYKLKGIKNLTRFKADILETVYSDLDITAPTKAQRNKALRNLTKDEIIAAVSHVSMQNIFLGDTASSAKARRAKINLRIICDETTTVNNIPYSQVLREMLRVRSLNYDNFKWDESDDTYYYSGTNIGVHIGNAYDSDDIMTTYLVPKSDANIAESRILERRKNIALKKSGGGTDVAS